MGEYNLEEHKAAAFEEFWQWRETNGIGDQEEDWSLRWECFWAGYQYASQGDQP